MNTVEYTTEHLKDPYIIEVAKKKDKNEYTPVILDIRRQGNSNQFKYCTTGDKNSIEFFPTSEEAIQFGIDFIEEREKIRMQKMGVDKDFTL